MKILKEKNHQQETFNRKGPMVLKTVLKNVPINVIKKYMVLQIN